MTLHLEDHLSVVSLALTPPSNLAENSTYRPIYICLSAYFTWKAVLIQGRHV